MYSFKSNAKFLLVIVTVAIIMMQVSCSAPSDKDNATNILSANKSFYDELSLSNISENSEFREYTLPSFISGTFSKPLYAKDILDDKAYIFEVDDLYCSVSKVNDDNTIQYLFMLYQKEDGLLVDSIYTDKFYSIDDFKEINKGDTFTEIEKIVTVPVVLEFSETQNVSYYWLNDGRCIVFTMENNVVNKIEIQEDKYHLFDKLKASKTFTVTQSDIVNREIDNDNDDDDGKLFDDYEGILSAESKEFYNAINNNPIDEYYLKQFNDDSAPNHQVEVMYQWIDAYEEEYDYIYEYLLDKLNADDSEEAKTLIEQIKKYDEQSDYPQTIALLTSAAEDYALGHGTGHRYDAAYNYLVRERNKVLVLVEIANLSFDKTYQWHFDSEN